MTTQQQQFSSNNRQESGGVLSMSIGQYLIDRLQAYGIRDLFGIPGDYILHFYSMLEKSPINVIGCTREDNAGFAADAYARINGMGALCVTYCVGGLSVCNSIAGAYAEKSPVVMITGSPGLKERINNPLLHHKVRDFSTQREVFEKLCVATAELNDPVTAFREIERVLDAAAHYKRPVYLDIPRDMVEVVPHISHRYDPLPQHSNPKVLAEAVEESLAMLARAKRPMILAGVEVHRFGLQKELLALAEKSQMPIAATVLGKSVVSETHPLYIGLYEGAMGDERVTQRVEESDCLLMLGTFLTDINLGIYTANLDPGRCILATSEQLRVRWHHFHDINWAQYLHELGQQLPQPVVTEAIPRELKREPTPYKLDADAKITISRLNARLNEQLDDHTIVVADIGDALFGATELQIRGQTEFLSPAYYTSMGFGVPAALGASVARPEGRVVAIVGDGAFQMTGMELSTIVRRGNGAIVIVLNNRGYGTERILHAGDWKFNEIHNWNYHKLPEVLGGGRGHEVRTEGEFDRALTQAWEDRKTLHLIEVHLDPADCSTALKRLAAKMAENI